MKKNIYFVASQINIIMISAVAIEHQDEWNTLFIFKAFDVDQRMLDRLKQIYNEIVVCDNTTRLVDSWVNRIQSMNYCYKLINTHLKDNIYDRVITSVDGQLLPTIMLKKIVKNNKEVGIACLADGIGVWHNYVRLGVANNRFLYACRRFVFKRIFRLDGYYTDMSFDDLDHPAFCCARKFEKLYCLKAKFLSSAQKARECVEIGEMNLKRVIGILYGGMEELTIDDGSIVLLLDLISSNGNMLKIIQDIEKISDKKIYMKFHPRETNPMIQSSDVNMIEQNVASEGVMANNTGKDIVFIGNMTTALIWANVMGYKAVSLMDILHEDSDLWKSVFLEYNVNILQSINEISEL